MPSLLFCGPKLAACGIVLSVWGVIMLVSVSGLPLLSSPLLSVGLSPAAVSTLRAVVTGTRRAVTRGFTLWADPVLICSCRVLCIFVWGVVTLTDCVLLSRRCSGSSSVRNPLC